MSEEPQKKKRKLGAQKAAAATEEQKKYSITENGTKIEVSTVISQDELVSLVADHGTTVKELRFQYEDESQPISFSDFEFPNLEKLEFYYCAVDFFSLVNAPKLKWLSIEQASYCSIEHITFRLPSLEVLSFEFCTINDPSDFGESLTNSPLLERFIAYKLWGLGDSLGRKTVYLPSCTDLSLYRSDDISSLKIYAPRLQSLNLRACYDMSKLWFGKRGKKGHAAWNLKSPEKPTPFTVNVVNSGIRGECRKYLKSHPRVSFITWQANDNMFMCDFESQGGDDERAKWNSDYDEEERARYF